MFLFCCAVRLTEAGTAILLSLFTSSLLSSFNTRSALVIPHRAQVATSYNVTLPALSVVNEAASVSVQFKLAAWLYFPRAFGRATVGWTDRLLPWDEGTPFLNRAPSIITYYTFITLDEFVLSRSKDSFMGVMLSRANLFHVE